MTWRQSFHTPDSAPTDSEPRAGVLGGGGVSLEAAEGGAASECAAGLAPGLEMSPWDNRGTLRRETQSPGAWCSLWASHSQATKATHHTLHPEERSTQLGTQRKVYGFSCLGRPVGTWITTSRSFKGTSSCGKQDGTPANLPHRKDSSPSPSQPCTSSPRAPAHLQDRMCGSR